MSIPRCWCAAISSVADAMKRMSGSLVLLSGVGTQTTTTSVFEGPIEQRERRVAQQILRLLDSHQRLQPIDSLGNGVDVLRSMSVAAGGVVITGFEQRQRGLLGRAAILADHRGHVEQEDD